MLCQHVLSGDGYQKIVQVNKKKLFVIDRPPKLVFTGRQYRQLSVSWMFVI